MFNTNTVSTLEYMSPETLNHSVYYRQSDVYSFAILAYELFIEKDFTPFSGYQHIDAITNKKYRPSLEELRNFGEIKEMISRAWDDDWKTRPSMQEICQILQKAKAEFK